MKTSPIISMFNSRIAGGNVSGTGASSSLQVASDHEKRFHSSREGRNLFYCVAVNSLSFYVYAAAVALLLGPCAKRASV